MARRLAAAAGLVTALSAPATALAQTVPTSATPWDVTGVVGLLSGHPPDPVNRGYVDDWFNSAQAGMLLGRHLTPHVKAEIELTTSSEGRRFVERYIQLPNYPYPLPLGSEQFTRIHELGLALTYQFFENEWVHPFVQIGSALDVDRVRTHTWTQGLYTGDPRQPGTQVLISGDADTGPRSTIHARAVAGAGAKLYVTPRAFIRTDARFAAGGHGQHLVMRAGIGIDWGR